MTSSYSNLKKRFFPWIAIILIINGCGEDAGPSAPTITGIDPQNGPAGTAVTITGTGFGTTQASNKVMFNGKEATVTTASATQLVAEVPAAAGTGNVTVEVGGKTVTGPTFTYIETVPTKTFYIRFKVNGAWKLFETSNPGYQSCGNCACNTMPPLSTSNFTSLSLCQGENDWIVASDIVSWDKKQILFKTNNVFPEAGFGFAENGITFHSSYAADQTGSSLTVTNVEGNGDFFGKLAFKVTGTFQCKVAASDGSSVTTVTEGSFVVRYSEE